MRFGSDDATKILRQQTVPVMVCDAAGAPIIIVPNPKQDFEKLAHEIGCEVDQVHVQRGFIGVGNKRRIRYVQALNPSVWGAGWRGGSHTTIKVPARNAAGDAVSAPRHEHRLLRFLQ